MAVRLAVLIPHSRGVASGGDDPPWQPGESVLPELDAARSEVLAAAGLADEPTLPCSKRYTGVLATELDWAGLPAVAKRRGRAGLLTVDGLLGASAPGDPVPEHRVAPGDRVDGLGRMSTWWRPRLTAALAEHLRGATVWDLLPVEHSAAWEPDRVPMRRRITVDFLDGDGKRVAHWNKLLKGAVVRWVLSEGVQDGADAASFEHPAGYEFDPVLSTLDDRRQHLVFRAH